MMFSKRGSRVSDEAVVLGVARHPGVVELVDVVGDVLRTKMVDARQVGEMSPLPAAEVAGVAAAVATTLADLHDLGVVHGGIDASHVLVTAGGRPLLCSLGRGGQPADDVFAMGRLVMSLLAQSPAEQPVGRLNRRLLVRRQLGTMLAPPAGPTLAVLAAEAMAPDPDDRPSARAFADSIGRRIPAARLPGTPTTRAPAKASPRGFGARKRRIATVSAARTAAASRLPGTSTTTAAAQAPLRRFVGNKARISTLSADEAAVPPRPGLPGRRGDRALTAATGAVAGLVAVVAVLAGVAVAASRALSRHSDRSGAIVTRTDGKGTTVAAPTKRATGGCSPHCASPAHERELTPAAPQPLAVTTTGPVAPPATTTPAATRVWPAESLELRDGVFTYQGSRYELGHPVDTVVAGDWNCTGERSLALLRRGAGDIFAFDGWPQGDGVLTARHIGHVDRAVDLRVVDIDGDGCQELQVERAHAPAVHVKVNS